MYPTLFTIISLMLNSHNNINIIIILDESKFESDYSNILIIIIKAVSHKTV